MSDGRLIICPTPIGNLEDVTLRVLAALREADIVACEDTRRTRVLLDRYGVTGASSATTSTTSAARRASSWRGCARAPWLRSSPTPACRSSPIPASCSSRRASPPGWRSRCCLGLGGARGAGGERAARRPVALRGLPAAQARGARASVRLARDAGRVRVAEAGGGVLRRSPSSTRAASRGVPRADQAPRGDRARNRRRAGGPVRVGAARAAKSCSSSAAPRRPRTRSDRRSTRCAGWSTPAPSRVPRRRWSSELTGVPREPALSRAHVEGRRNSKRRSFFRSEAE